MVSVTVYFSRYDKTDTKEFNNVKTALRFMYSMQAKGNIVISYSCDDPLDTRFLERRFRL